MKEGVDRDVLVLDPALRSGDERAVMRPILPRFAPLRPRRLAAARATWRRAAPAILAPLVWAGMAFADPSRAVDGPERVRVEGVAQGDVLFLRERPDSASAQVGSLPPDAGGIENLGCVNTRGGQARPETNLATGATWCRLRHGGVEGYANARFLRADAQPAGPASPAAFPAEVQARLAEAERACRAKGLSWAPNPAFVRPVDLGQRRQDYILNDRVAGCGADGKGLCDAGSCRVQVLVARADGSLHPAFDAAVLGYRLRDVDGRPVLQLHQRGSACGRPGIDECWRALELRGEALVPAR